MNEGKYQLIGQFVPDLYGLITVQFGTDNHGWCSVKLCTLEDV